MSGNLDASLRCHRKRRQYAGPARSDDQGSRCPRALSGHEPVAPHHAKTLSRERLELEPYLVDGRTRAHDRRGRSAGGDHASRVRGGCQLATGRRGTVDDGEIVATLGRATSTAKNKRKGARTQGRKEPESSEVNPQKTNAKAQGLKAQGRKEPESSEVNRVTPFASLR